MRSSAPVPRETRGWRAAVAEQERPEVATMRTTSHQLTSVLPAMSLEHLMAALAAVRRDGAPADARFAVRQEGVAPKAVLYAWWEGPDGR